MSLLNPKKLLRTISSQFVDDQMWCDALNAAGTIHLAVMVEPFLSYLLDGTKTIESRFSLTKVLPYRRVASGDLLLLKQSGGPIVGIARVGRTKFIELTPTTWPGVKTLSKRICGDSNFWKSQAKKRYATLLHIAGVRALEPIFVHKTDRRPWVILPSNGSQPQHIKTLVMLSGKAGSGKSTIANILVERFGYASCSFGNTVRMEAERRQLPKDVISLQNLGKRLIRDWGWVRFCQTVLAQANGNPNVVVDGLRHCAARDVLLKITAPGQYVSVFIEIDETVRLTRLQARKRFGEVLAVSLPMDTELDSLRSQATLLIKGDDQQAVDKIIAQLE